MSTWLPALPALLVVVAIVLLPGAATASAAGARGIVAWGVAPALSLTSLSVGASVAPILHLTWSPWLYLAAAGAGVAVAALSRFVGRAVRGRGPTPDPVRTRWFALAGVLVGTGLVLAAVLPAIGTPDELVDSTDAVAHLNRLRLFLDTGTFSSLGSSAGPAYPSAFHDIAGTLAQTLTWLGSGHGLITAVNLTAIAAAAVIWPVGLVALTRLTLGRAGVTLLAAGVMSAAFTVFPYILMGWGVLWPNLLGTAVLPGVLGPALLSLGVLPSGPALSRRLGVVLTVGALPGLTLAHPNATVSLALILLLALATRLLLLWRRGPTSSPRARRAGVALVTLVLVVVAGLLAAPRLSQAVADTASYDWGAHDPLGPSVRDSAFLALQEGEPPWSLLALMAVGAVVAARRARLRWVLVTWGALVALFVVAATGRPGWGSLVTGYWYNDKVRLAALLAVPAALLGVVGVTEVARLIARWLASFTPPLSARRRRPWALPLVSGGGAVALTLAITAGAYHDRVGDLVDRYHHPPESTHVLLTPSEDADLAALAVLIPPGVVTADVPANGSALLYALHDRPVLFTSLLLDPEPDHALIGLHLKDAASRPDVCDALRRDNVQYAVTAPIRYWLSLSERTTGMAALGGAPGFLEVGAAGRYRLYRIQACGFDPSWLPPR